MVTGNKMRRILLAAAAFTLMTLTVLTSCTKDDPEIPVPESEAEYTIMYYGHGGGNREYFYLSKIGDFYQAGADALKRVNVVVQYKFSTAENMKTEDLGDYDDNTCETFGGRTVRWAVDTTKTFQEQVFSRANFYGAGNADLTCPDSLTHFINWATKAYPAKKYMLIVHDHGGCYMPVDELPEAVSTRGLIYDDGNLVDGSMKHFTAKSFTRAIRQAGVHMETIFMDACMMNCLEYQFELQDLCDYVIAPSYSKPSIDGAYRMLPKLLGQPSVNIEQALDSYCKAAVESWDRAWQEDETVPFYSDLTVTRTSGIAQLGVMLREFTDRLCDIYTNGTEAQKQAIDDCTAHALKIQINQPNYDAIKYVKSIVTALPEVYGGDFSKQMKDAFNNCIVSQYFSRYLTVHEFMVDYSVMLGTLGTFSYVFWATHPDTGAKVPYGDLVYSPDGEMQFFYLFPTDDPQHYRMEVYGERMTWASTLADTYEQLAFDQAVGWSRWLRLNRQWPNLFCPKDLDFELPIPQKQI